MANFDIGKFTRTSKSLQIIPTSFIKKPRTIIAPETIESLAAEGLNIGQIAKRLKLSQSYLSQRIGETLTMTHAYKRGRELYTQKLKTI